MIEYILIHLICGITDNNDFISPPPPPPASVRIISLSASSLLSRENEALTSTSSKWENKEFSKSDNNSFIIQVFSGLK